MQLLVKNLRLPGKEVSVDAEQGFFGLQKDKPWSEFDLAFN